MSALPPALPLAACPTCGRVHGLPTLSPTQVARCTRCGALLAHGLPRARTNERTAAAALAALLLYPAAISWPILRLERFGQSSSASVWSGSVGLMQEGFLWVGVTVFLCSVVVPLLKLVTLLVLSLAPDFLDQAPRARLWRAVELAGRWGMLDVLLVSVVVAWLKIGDLVEVTPGPAAVAFTGCVLASLLAGAWFDPHSLWEAEPATSRASGGPGAPGVDA